MHIDFSSAELSWFWSWEAVFWKLVGNLVFIGYYTQTGILHLASHSANTEAYDFEISGYTHTSKIAL